MIAPACRHTATKRYGKDRHGNPRVRCILCGKTWTKQEPKPLGEMRLEKSKAILCLRLLLECNSIRAVERITGVHRDTILNLLETVGRNAKRFWATRMQNLPVMDVEVDEVWDFVGCKEKTRQRKLYDEEWGDVYTFTAIERTSKLLLTYHVGRRTMCDTANFAERLYHAVGGQRCQLTSDGFGPYEYVVPAVFRGQVDFAQLIKIFGNPSGTAEVRYSPGAIMNVRLHCVSGYPDPALVCTSHVERHNLAIRTDVKRMARLTIAFSKKRVNHEYALAIYFLYYNFCRVHSTLKTTPAVKAGIATEKWSVERLVDELAKD
jgi:transposase-like protein/IS1 family transposase